MIIKNIHIDNYGKYSGREFSGFSSGVNVVYGPNEHGKTTLLEFVRRMFFGFPPGTYRKNRFSPVNGALPGGRLLCLADSGKEFKIERQGWTKGGAIKIDSRDAVQHELNELLRAGELFYQNVYAITIEELHSMEALSGEEIKNRIYGAGLDLGGLSLARIKKQLQGDAEKIFKAGGSKQEIHLLNEERRNLEQQIKAAEQNLSRFEEILQEETGNKEKIALISEKLNALNSSCAALENKCSARSEFIDYEDFDSRLKKIPECATVTQDDLDECRNLQAALEKAVSREQEHQESARELEEKLKATIINHKLAEHRGRINMLERASDRYRAECENIKNLTVKIEQFEEHLGTTENNIASLWETGKIPENFCFELKFIDRVREFENAFNDFRQQLLALETLQRQQEQMPQAHAANNITPAITLFAIFAAVAIAGGILLPPMVAIAIAALTCVPASIIIAAGFKQKKKQEFQNPQDMLAEQRIALSQKWNEFLQAKGFKKDLSPASIITCADNYNNLSRNRSESAALRKELENKKIWIKEIENAVNELATVLEPDTLTPDTLANIEIISGIAQNNEKAVAEYENCQSELKKIKSRITADNAAVENSKKALSEFLDKFNAANLPELRTLFRHSGEREKFLEKRQESWNRLKNIFGIDAKIEDVRILLQEFSRDDAEQELKKLHEQQQELETERTALNHKNGALAKEREILISGDQLVELYNRHENCIQRIRDHAGRWARFHTAELLINRAVANYEIERQPEVITQASALFSKLTGGEYTGIRKPAESDDLLLFGANGNTRKVLELSRGTREQLYLAMRLGLIAQYEEKAESLPLIFDDILVNFDEQRLKNAVNAIFEFARDRQVIILTCHESTYKLMLKEGASDISS